MTIMMEIECGTKHRTKFQIDLDKYGECDCKVDLCTYKEAFDLLRRTMDDPTFIDDGHRNDDAVNGCIALHVMGYDPQSWFNDFFDANDDKFLEYDICKFEDHVKRVCGYLDVWGPAGAEYEALAFALC